MNNLLSIIYYRFRSAPKALYVLFYTQMWELFGRYGITSILILYLTKTFHLSDSQAFSIYSAFIALCFATPILGGYLSDRFLGSRQAILLGAISMLLGNALMVIPIEAIVFLGLAIVAIGSGFFLPSIPPLVGALYEKDESKRDAGFTIYYLATNLGALIAPILCGIVGDHFGLNYAFALSALGMLSGVIVFYCGEKHLRAYIRQPTQLQKSTVNKVNTHQCLIYLLCPILIPFFYIIITKNVAGDLLLFCGIVAIIIVTLAFIKHSSTERKRMVVILTTIFFVTIFEACLWQGGTTLNLFIDRIVDRKIFGLSIPTSAFFALDPIFMFIVGPILAVLWSNLGKRNKEPFASTKFALGLALLGIGFLIFVIAAIHAKYTGSAQPFYVVLAYFVFPIAELCIVPVSLSLVTKLAPKKLESLFVSLWMLSNAASSYFTGIISKYGNINFQLQNASDYEKAAGIYQSLFSATAIGLLVFSVIALLTVPLMKKLANNK